MLRARRAGAAGGSHRFCFAKIGPEVFTYGLRGEAPAEGSKQLKTRELSLWKLRKAFEEL